MGNKLWTRFRVWFFGWWPLAWASNYWKVLSELEQRPDPAELVDLQVRERDARLLRLTAAMERVPYTVRRLDPEGLPTEAKLLLEFYLCAVAELTPAEPAHHCQAVKSEPLDFPPF